VADRARQSREHRTGGRMRRGSFFAAAVSSLLLAATLAPDLFAQTGTIVGTVTDSDSGAPLTGADVILEGTSYCRTVAGRRTIRATRARPGRQRAAIWPTRGECGQDPSRGRSRWVLRTRCGASAAGMVSRRILPAS
jgi:hypothetical protein